MKIAEAERLNSEGESLYKSKKYAEALSKYQAAINQLPPGNDSFMKKIQDNETLALNAQNTNLKIAEAERLNSEGESLYQSKKYAEALSKYQAAINQLPPGNDSIMKKIQDNETMALNAQNTNLKIAEAERLNSEGESLYQSKKYAEALIKYQQAMKTLPSGQNLLKSNIQNNRAIALNAQGLIHLQNSQFVEAIDNFDAAYETTSDEPTKMVFANNFNLAKSENLNNIGETLVNQRKFADATNKFQEALVTCPPIETSALKKFKNNLASSLNQEGVLLVQSSQLSLATDKFKQALNISNNYGLSHKISENINNVEARTLSFEGQTLANSKLYSNAVVKFNSALEKETDNETKESLLNLKAESLNNWGEELKRQNKFDDAIKKFDEAMATTKNQDDAFKLSVKSKVLKGNKVAENAKTLWNEGWNSEKTETKKRQMKSSKLQSLNLKEPPNWTQVILIMSSYLKLQLSSSKEINFMEKA